MLCVCVCSRMTVMIRWVWDNCRRREDVLRGLLEKGLVWEDPCAPSTMSPPPSTPQPSLPSLTAIPKLTAAPHKALPSPWALKEVRLPPRPPVLHVKLDSSVLLRLVLQGTSSSLIRLAGRVGAELGGAGARSSWKT